MGLYSNGTEFFITGGNDIAVDSPAHSSNTHSLLTFISYMLCYCK